uniref:EF-hand domain-containing protein n=1 Tax=Anas platyrhynchos platyrhynchos TaxID=8840 RepID=A0A493TG83_ANAPP
MADCTELEWAIQVLVNNFDNAGTRGGQLLLHIWGPPHLAPPFPQHQHLRSLPQDTGNRRAADKLICDLDENKDGRISFEEYWTLIGEGILEDLRKQKAPQKDLNGGEGWLGWS